MTDTSTAPSASGSSSPGDDDLDARIDAALGELTLEEKVRLLTGRDFWSTWPIERIGLRSIVFSDGPAGVRGPVWDERSPSLNLPSGSALAASWDVATAHRYGAAAAAEARRKGVDVVLGPTINLHRSPRGGRHFEAFSEDPVLTADLAAAYVAGLQENGVAATPKHYIANDAETDRFTVDVVVDERPLRELYLLAFEKAIVQSRSWAIMSSYNSINGITATESDLLHTPLNDEWGFDGAVVSDWTAVRSLASASADQDVVMPGPDGPWGDALVAAVREGRIAEGVVGRKVHRLLHLAARVGAFADREPLPIRNPEDGETVAVDAAIDGAVLLANRGELPWAATSLARVAVIGNNADVARTQGGGSATVLPERVVSPLDGLRAALPDAEVTYSVGAINQVGLAGFPREAITNPATGGPGARVTFRDADGAAIHEEDRLATEFIWFGGDAPTAEAAEVEVAFALTPTRTERVEVGISLTGRGRLWIDGALAIDEDVIPDGDDLGAAILSPATVTVPVDLVAGRSVDLRFVADTSGPTGSLGVLALTVGSRPVDGDAEALIAEAVEAARAADVAVVVVGTNSRVESEGFDRESLALPGRQDDLVRAVAAANPRTVVVVNAGSPVLLPWRDDVAAVLLGWFGGQGFGTAIARVLFGDDEPGGRLPTTWPAAEHDVPVLETVPTDGVLRYEEGIHIGYRAWARSGATPAYAFGHGLGYTSIEPVAAPAALTVAADGAATLEVEVANTGARAGKQVVQVYASRADSAVERPALWLVGFAVARLAAGASTTVSIDLPARSVAHWVSGRDGSWAVEPGAYQLRIGTAVDALPLATTLTVEA